MEFLSRLTVFVLVGAVLGLLAGLLLLALGVVENPFWAVSAGILVAAVVTPLRPPGRSPREG